MAITTQFQKDRLTVKIMDSRREMGRVAASDTACALRALLAQKEEVNMIFAAAPSQNELLDALCSEPDIDWGRVNAFHMDEYIGLPENAPQSFGMFLKNAVFDRLPFQAVYYIAQSGLDTDGLCARYEKLLAAHPIDIICLGIGENGHIAFNDPPVADFADPKVIKEVQLDEICRNQQVHDGCFASLDQVPKSALTLTVPTMFSGKKLFCVVPAATKADAVYAMLNDEISTACPASILRTHECAALYLDPDSSAKLCGKDERV